MAEYLLFHSQYTAQQIEDAIGKGPIVDDVSGNWKVWNVGLGAYEDTGVHAEGDPGPNVVNKGDTLTDINGAVVGDGSKIQMRSITDTPASGNIGLITSRGVYSGLHSVEQIALAAFPQKSLASAPLHTFGDGADGVPVKAMSAAVNAVQNGTPDPDSPSTISARSSASVVDNGINQWDEVWEQGNINNSGENAPSNTIIRSKNYIRISPSTEYYFCGSGIKPYYYDEYKNFLNTAASKTNQTTTTPAGAYYMRFVQTGTSYGNNISINYPSTDTAYHAYAGRTVTMSFGESVYGGTLDLVGGKNWNLTVDRAYVALDSSFAGTIDLATNANTQQVLFRAAVTGADTTKLTDVQTNYFEGGTTSTTPYRARVSQRGSLFDVAISFPVGTFTDVNDFKANWLTGKTLQVVYFIATHRVVEIEADADTVTVYGDNVLYADCGDSSLTYRQDIGLVLGE